MSKFLNLDNVLCFSPHPDDVEYGMLGSMIKHSETNFHIMVFSYSTDILCLWLRQDFFLKANYRAPSNSFQILGEKDLDTTIRRCLFQNFMVTIDAYKVSS